MDSRATYDNAVLYTCTYYKDKLSSSDDTDPVAVFFVLGAI